MKRHCISLAAAIAVLSLQPVLAEPVARGPIEIRDAWARATPPGAPTAGGYLTIANTGAEPDRLIGVEAFVAATVEVHEMRVKDGVMVMRARPDGIEIPAGGTLTLAPGGYHLMFMGLKEGLAHGDSIPVTLTFEKAGTVAIALDVAPIGAPGPAAGRDPHGHADQDEKGIGQ